MAEAGLNFDDLLRFHREIALPDIERLIDSRTAPLYGRFDTLRDEMSSHFDAVYKKLDRLETEYQALSAAVKRLEERVAAVEQKLDRMALRSELLELEARVKHLEEEVAALRSES